jgi:hypothetical protein
MSLAPTLHIARIAATLQLIMTTRAARAPAFLAATALVLLVPLLVWNLAPGVFPQRAHQTLAALPLALIALGSLLHQLTRRPGRRQLLQALLLSTGFCLWSANMVLPEALLLNDIAIVLFVLDLFLGITGACAGRRRCSDPSP